MAQILRVTVNGALPSGEKWSVNPCWEINGSGGDPVSPGLAVTIATALGAVTVPAGLTALMSNQTSLTGYRVEARSLTGDLEAQAEFIKPSATFGSGTAYHPFQTSCVFSLRTPLPGARFRGRLYWPATGAGLVSTTLRLDPTVQSTALSAAKTYLSAMETAIQASLPNANLTIWSRTYAGFANVNSIRIGNVLDTQRRRRDTLIEAEVSASYP